MKFKTILSIFLVLLIGCIDQKPGNKTPEAIQLIGYCDELTKEMFEPKTDASELVGLNGKYWTKDTIKVYFKDGSESLKADNLSYFKEWEKYTRLKIVRVNSTLENPNIVVTFEQVGSRSFIGTDSEYGWKANGWSMQLGWNAALQYSNPAECKGTAIHEFGHACGFVHEHQSPKSTCVWNTTLLYSDYKKLYGWDEAATKSNIVDRYSESQTNSSTYDIESVMHYEFNPKYVTGCTINTVRRLVLSPMDKIHAAKIYPPKIIVPPTDTIKPPPTGEYILVTKGKPATQSSSSFWPASNVNNGIYTDFNHTLREQNPWIKIDMGAEYSLTRVKIYNRVGCAQCVGRLRNFKVVISNHDGVIWPETDVVYNYTSIVKDGEIFDLAVNKKGRYLILMADNTNNPSIGFLHLAELEGYTGKGTVIEPPKPVCKDTVYKVPVWTQTVRDSVGRVCR